MRVVVPTSKGGLDDEVHESLVRAETFTVVELEDGTVKDVKVLENPYRSEPHGAGSKVALFVANLGADILVTRADCPKGKLILDSAGVRLVKVGRAKVRDVLSGL